MSSLRIDPPQQCSFRVVSVTEGGDSVSVYYEYVKTAGTLMIAQLFRYRDNLISEILLVFDGRGFA